MQMKKQGNPRIRYLLLDVHGVLTKPGRTKRFLPYMEKRYGMDHDRHNALLYRYLDELESGAKKQSEYLRVINNAFGTSISVGEYYRLFGLSVKLNEHFIRKLSRMSIRICIVSDDAPPLSVSLGKALDRRFKSYRKFYSYQYGYCKTDGLLKDVLKELDAKPEECLFVDDRKKNIDVAKKMGMNVILFKTNKELFAEFRRYGIF